MTSLDLLRVFLITTPILIVGLVLAWLLERRPLSTFWPTFALRNTLLITGTAILATLVIGPYVRPLISLSVPKPSWKNKNQAKDQAAVAVPALQQGTNSTIAVLPVQSSSTVAVPTPASVSPSISGSPDPILIIWGVMTALLLGTYLVSALVLLQVVRRAQVAPQKWVDLVHHIITASERKITPPQVKVSTAVTSPLVIDLPGQPTILLLPAFLSDSQDEILPVILAHELAHQTRRDGHWALGVRLLSAVFWFQPLLWLLMQRMERAAEFDCDAEALRQTALFPITNPKQNYASSLLSYAEIAMQESLLVRSTAALRITGSTRIFSTLFLKERIERIMEKRPTEAVVPVRSWRYGTVALLSFFALTSVALFGASAKSAVVEPQGPDTVAKPAIPTVTGDWRDVPFEQALKDVLQGTGLDYRLSSNLTWEQLGAVNLKVTLTSVDRVIPLLLRCSTYPNLKHRREGNIIWIEPARLDKNGLPTKKLRVQVTDQPIRDVLASMFQGTDASFSLPTRATGRITVDTGKEVDFATALDAVLKAYHELPLRYYGSHGSENSVSISLIPRLERPGPAPASDPMPESRVTIDVNKAPLRTTLEQIFQTAHLDYSIAAEVSGTVTLKCDDMPIQEVLPLLLKQGSIPLTYYYYTDEGMIVRSPKK